MKILFTGGGSGGHFYPLIAVAEAIKKISFDEKLVKPALYYMSTAPYDEKALADLDIEFVQTFSGKSRVYFSLINITDMFMLAAGIVSAFFKIYLLYPDIVVSKGGYGSIPAVLAARLLRIPILVHESDSVPGRANVWAGKFADRVAVSWPESAQFFPKAKTAITGQPVRNEILMPAKHGAFEYLGLNERIPVVYISGGSQGARIFNDALLDILPQMVEKYQIIHQTGQKNLTEVSGRAKVILEKNAYAERYKPFDYLNDLALKMVAGVTSLAISRAGSSIFEIAAWGLPSIIVPITNSNADHQRENAFNYARKGACVVIEEENLTPHLLLSEIDRLFLRPEEMKKMGESARAFWRGGAADQIAHETLRIALEHE